MPDVVECIKAIGRANGELREAGKFFNDLLDLGKPDSCPFLLSSQEYQTRGRYSATELKNEFYSFLVGYLRSYAGSGNMRKQIHGTLVR